MFEENFEIKRQALYETIADRLELMILHDTTKLEQPLPSEQFLADSFNVSRPVIREALKILKERGLIATRQGAKTIVTVPSADTVTNSLNRLTQLQNISVSQLFQVRIALETLAVRIATRNCAADAVARLQEINAQIENSTPLEAARLDAQFHKTIAELSGNPMLLIMIESLRGLIADAVYDILRTWNLKADAVQFHQKIIHCIQSKDEDAAAEMMRAHLLVSMKNHQTYQQEKG